VGQEGKWREMLRHHRGWMIEEQASDGNCLFRSVAHQGIQSHSLTPHAFHLPRCICVSFSINTMPGADG
jgi:hypothetical protein